MSIRSIVFKMFYENHLIPFITNSALILSGFIVFNLVIAGIMTLTNFWRY